MIRGFKQIASLTAISRVFGMIRDIAFSHFFGAGKLMDAWIIAFQIANLSRRLFGEGEHHLRVRVLCAEVAVQQYPRQAKNDDRG